MICKGSYNLGTACGQCEKCKDYVTKLEKIVEAASEAGMNEFKCRCKEIAFHRDVFEIAKYLMWSSDIGRDKAQEIIDSIHKGKYGSKSGIWIQYEDMLDREELEGDN